MFSTMSIGFGDFQPQIRILHVEFSPETDPEVWKLEICIKMRAMSLFMASPTLWGEKSVQIINIFRFTHLHKYRLHGGVKLANEKCWSKSWNPGPLSDWPKLTLNVLRLGLNNKRNPFRIDDLQKNQIFLLWAFVILMLPPNNPKFSVRIM